MNQHDNHCVFSTRFFLFTSQATNLLFSRWFLRTCRLLSDKLWRGGNTSWRLRDSQVDCWHKNSTKFPLKCNWFIAARSLTGMRSARCTKAVAANGVQVQLPASRKERRNINCTRNTAGCFSHFRAKVEMIDLLFCWLRFDNDGFVSDALENCPQGKFLGIGKRENL